MVNYINYNTLAQISQRIEFIEKINEIFISNTQIPEIINSAISPSQLDDNNLDYLYQTLNSAIINEQLTTITSYGKVNEILTAIEKEIFSRKVGYGYLSQEMASESFDGGETYIPTIKGIIGPWPIDKISPNDDNTISGALGNKKLSSVVIFNEATPPANSITEQLDLLNELFTKAIGENTPLLIEPFLQLHSCSSSGLGRLIYEVPLEPSLADATNAIQACVNWAASSEFKGLINIDAYPYCTFLNEELALPNCLHYLTGKVIYEDLVH